MRYLGSLLTSSRVTAQDQESPVRQGLHDLPVRAEALSQDHAPCGFGGAAAAANQGEQDTADPLLRKMVEQLTICPIRIGAQCSRDTSNLLIRDERYFAFMLARPQLRESEFQQREPVSIAYIISDECDQSFLVPYASHMGWIGYYLLQAFPTHGRQPEPSVVKTLSGIAMIRN